MKKNKNLFGLFLFKSNNTAWIFWLPLEVHGTMFIKKFEEIYKKKRKTILVCIKDPQAI